MSEGFKPLAASLGAGIEALERRAKAALDLAGRVRDALPAPDKDHVISASYADETLIVTVDSAAWCSRLRFLEQTVIERLRAAGETQVAKLKFRVGARA